MRVYENRVLGRIFGPKRDEVRKLRTEKLGHMHLSLNIIRKIKCRRLKWVEPAEVKRVVTVSIILYLLLYERSACVLGTQELVVASQFIKHTPAAASHETSLVRGNCTIYSDAGDIHYLPPYYFKQNNYSKRIAEPCRVL
jgi:hypothetical protein